MSEPLIFLVDDEEPVRRALARRLSVEGFEVATFASAEAFLAHADLTRPGCIVLDMAMPETDGLELQRQLHERGCALPILFLTACQDVPMAVQALKSGALDFLPKPVSDAVLLDAVRSALAKDRLAREKRSEIEEIASRLATLTPREREVLEHIVRGRLNKQVAADLGTVEKTIKVHRARVMEKMKVGSVAELARQMERIAADR